MDRKALDRLAVKWGVPTIVVLAIEKRLLDKGVSGDIVQRVDRVLKREVNGQP